MPRVDLLAEGDDLTPEAREVAERVAATRGKVSRPFQLLLHSPALAERVADLGHLVRTGSALIDADRELVTLATGIATGCAFIVESHLDTAAAVGVPNATIEALRRDPGDLVGRARSLVSFVEELCSTRTVSDATFEAVRGFLDANEVVELSLTIGYYSMLASVMGACDAC